MLSSETEGGRLATETPIKSADSWRVETDERRRWCEVRLEEGTRKRLACAPGWPEEVDETGETSVGRVEGRWRKRWKGFENGNEHDGEWI